MGTRCRMHTTLNLSQTREQGAMGWDCDSQRFPAPDITQHRALSYADRPGRLGPDTGLGRDSGTAAAETLPKLLNSGNCCCITTEPASLCRLVDGNVRNEAEARLMASLAMNKTARRVSESWPPVALSVAVQYFPERISRICVYVLCIFTKLNKLSSLSVYIVRSLTLR